MFYLGGTSSVDHQLAKLVHLSCVIANFGMFFQRGVWGLRGSPMMEARWVKIVAHVVDTVLLASAVVLTLRIHQYPFVNAWFTAKVLGLLMYIGLGMTQTEQRRIEARIVV